MAAAKLSWLCCLAPDTSPWLALRFSHAAGVPSIWAPSPIPIPESRRPGRKLISLVCRRPSPFWMSPPYPASALLVLPHALLSRPLFEVLSPLLFILSLP